MQEDDWLEELEKEVDGHIAKHGMPTKEQIVKEIRLLNALLDEDDEPHPC